MTDQQVEQLMLAHYQVWLAFTTTRVMEDERWKRKESACLGFKIVRHRTAQP